MIQVSWWMTVRQRQFKVSCLKRCFSFCASASALAKRLSKRKNMLIAVVESCKAGQLEAPSATTADSHRDAEANMSDCNDVSNITTARQENEYYSEINV